MKKLFIILCLTFSFIYTNAQTETETIEWLKYQVLSVSEDGDIIKFNNDEMIIPTTWGTESKKVTSFDIIHYSKIKKIEFKENNLAIELIGDFKTDKNKSIGKSFITGVFNNIDKKEIEQFVKGIKHLAILKGAKFINENLFKN